MWIRKLGFGLWAMLVVLAGGGCNKSNPVGGANSPNGPTGTIARIHWLGKERVGADTNAAALMAIWRMPESVKVETQTLDKLSTAPWRLLHLTNQLSTLNPQPSTLPPTLNPQPSTLLRPLLDDLLLQEWYLEIRQVRTNQPGELALAVRLKPERAALWQTNLAAVVESLTGVRATPAASGAGWNSEFTIYDLRFTNRNGKGSGRAELMRAGEWTLVGMAVEQTGLLAEMAGRIERDHAPFARPPTNFWLQAELDLRRVGEALGLHWNLPPDSPRIAANWTGDGKNVRTRAELDFPRPLAMELEPWNMPTNELSDPLIGFMAVRGIRPWLKSFKPWNDLNLGTPPNQAYFWAQPGLFRSHFMALPSADASNQVSKLSAFTLKVLVPIIATNELRLGTFESSTNSPGVVWRGFPLLAPNLTWVDAGGNPFIVAGFAPLTPTNRAQSNALFQQLHESKDLVAYDWELTGTCTMGLGQLAQLVRHLFSLARLTDTTSLKWMAAVAPKLGSSVTGLRLTGPSHISFSRASTIGLTSPEIQVFIDWLESPEFPRGLHTFLAKPQPMLRRTNLPPATVEGTNGPPRAGNAH